VATIPSNRHATYLVQSGPLPLSGGMVGLSARALIRRNVVGTLAVALLIGIAGGAVLTAFAGARRTDRAIAQFQPHRARAGRAAARTQAAVVLAVVTD
jgi:hypothetical protein